MGIDKAGGNNQAGGIDERCGRVCGEITDRSHPLTGDTHVGFIPGITRAIDNLSAPDDDVIIILRQGIAECYKTEQQENLRPFHNGLLHN